MRVTEKGQVTIPKAIRDKLGIVPGSEVAFVARRGEVFLEKVDSDRTGKASAEALARHIERNRGRFDLEGMQADDVVKLLRD